MRPITLMEHPVYIPYVCEICGVGGGLTRKWFIDIGIENSIARDYREQGAIYFCNECTANFIAEVIKITSQWNEEIDGRSSTDISAGDAGLSSGVDDSSGSYEQSGGTSEQSVDLPVSTDADALDEQTVDEGIGFGNIRTGGVSF